jgi:hypothetical protein
MTQAPVDNSLSTAEAIHETPVAPGQESLLEEFLAERDAEQAEPEKILGKFNSQEELAKAYQELERKLGQPKDQPAETLPSPPKAYTREEGVKEYGEFLAGKFEEAEFNPYEMAAAFEAGQDVESFMAKLEGVGIPRSIVERYLEGGYESAPGSVELSAEDQAEIKGLVGGEEQFQQLSAWVKENVPQDEIDEYNAVVAAGNKEAIRWALKAMQARASQGSAPKQATLKEPELVGSGRAPSAGKTFESKAQVLEAMNKLNGKRQRLYDVDEAYRAQVIRMLDASDVF